MSGRHFMVQSYVIRIEIQAEKFSRILSPNALSIALNKIMYSVRIMEKTPDARIPI